jgi:hypothetical protein
MRRLERELLDRLKDALRGRPEEPVRVTGRDSRWKRPLDAAEPDEGGAPERRDERPDDARSRRRPRFGRSGPAGGYER